MSDVKLLTVSVDEGEQRLVRLRELHAHMDRAVLDAYGWSDLQPVHDFILDYEEMDDEPDSGKTRKRKEPWRYRWTDEFRDEVLARLLVLNRQRAEQEKRAGGPSKPKAAAKSGPTCAYAALGCETLVFRPGLRTRAPRVGGATTMVNGTSRTAGRIW